MRDALFDRDVERDRAVATAGRVLVVNRLPIASHGRHIGSVTTLRDRTELLELRASSTSPGTSPTRCARRPTSSATGCTPSPG